MSASPVASTSKPESSTATISATATAPKPASPAPSPTVTAAPSKPALEVKKPETADDKIASEPEQRALRECQLAGNLQFATRELMLMS